METDFWMEVDKQAKQWIKEAGRLLKDSFSDQVKVRFKSNPADLVTEMDNRIEQFFYDNIKKTYPEHQVLGEEGEGDDVKSLKGTVWMIDPIDGTMNFVHQKRHFAISVAVYHEGEGIIGLIYDVVSDDLYHAVKGNGAYLNGDRLPALEKVEVDRSVIGMNPNWVAGNRVIDASILRKIVKDVRGVRSYGSAAIELAYVAAGILDGYMTMRLSPWDFAAGMVLIEETGGTVTTVHGDPVDLLGRNSIFAAKSDLHESLLNSYIKGSK